MISKLNQENIEHLEIIQDLKEQVNKGILSKMDDHLIRKNIHNKEK